MLFSITADEVNDCLDFALVVRQSQRQFGTLEIRKAQQRIADTLTGKISEIALQKFLAQKGLRIAVDFAHYGAEEVTDNGQDIAAVQVNSQWQLCTYRVDSKGNAGTAQWLLVENHKYDRNYAQAYVMTKVHDIPRSEDLRRDPEIVRGKPCRAEICGYAYHEDFQDEEGQFWFVYQRGNLLIKTRYVPRWDAFPSAELMQKRLQMMEAQGRLEHYPVPMDANVNYGQPIPWLRNEPNDWAELIEHIKNNLEPAGQKFVSEYRIDAHNRVLNLNITE